MIEDNCYWYFSAEAQSIAAFIAFLMAGITVAFYLTDRISDQDDTIIDIIDSLKRRQHRQLIALSIVAGIAIIFSLWAVYLNPWQSGLRTLVRYTAVISGIIAIVGSIFFVLSIARPDKYKREALREYDSYRKGIVPTTKQESSAKFIRDFIELEKGIYEYILDHDMYLTPKDFPKRQMSFRQMIDLLYQNGRIATEYRNLLFEVSKYRNLVVHGRIDSVDEGVMQLLDEALSLWKRRDF